MLEGLEVLVLHPALLPVHFQVLPAALLIRVVIFAESVILSPPSQTFQLPENSALKPPAPPRQAGELQEGPGLPQKSQRTMSAIWLLSHISLHQQGCSLGPECPREIPSEGIILF